MCIECCSIRICIGSEKEGRKTRYFLSLCLHLGSASRTEYLETTHHIAIVPNLEFMSVFGIDILEHLPENLISSRSTYFFQLFAIFPIWRRIWVCHLIEDAIYVEPRSTTENRDFSSSMYRLYDRQCMIDIVYDRVLLTR